MGLSIVVLENHLAVSSGIFWLFYIQFIFRLHELMLVTVPSNGLTRFGLLRSDDHHPFWSHSNKLLSIWHWYVSSNASNSASANFLGCSLSFKSKSSYLNYQNQYSDVEVASCCPNQINHIWIIKTSTQMLKSMEDNPHNLQLANDDIQLLISSNGNENVTLPTHCTSWAKNGILNTQNRSVVHTSTEWNRQILKV